MTWEAYLEVDAVELVKARPRAAGRKALEELAHRNVVQRIGAVEHDALPRERLGKILRRLGLAGAGRAFRCAAEGEVDGAGEGTVAAVRQWRDDQPTAVSQVLVPAPVPP